ncbi:MAG TPA: RNA polymerase sigma factor [Candidatus Polarisedimenticolaceae bacterium]|nr:RNA polymerase sigma factor [Candidatus Polarisedimenticolaceae bacterium]
MRSPAPATLSDTPPDDDPRAVWPEHVLRLGAELRTSSGATRRRIMGALWGVVSVALRRYARHHARRFGRLDPEEIRDIASDKASDLVARIDEEGWDPAASTPASVRSFLSAVARNGVVDALRSSRKVVLVGDDLEPLERGGVEGGGQDDAAIGGEFVDTLLGCLSGLTARARKAWFLRVFYEFSSAEIARHPDVASSPAGVDAMLARSREQVRACMESKGVAMRTLPVGTFVRLWESTVEERSRLGADR